MPTSGRGGREAKGHQRCATQHRALHFPVYGVRQKATTVPAAGRRIGRGLAGHPRGRGTQRSCIRRQVSRCRQVQANPYHHLRLERITIVLFVHPSVANGCQPHGSGNPVQPCSKRPSCPHVGTSVADHDVHPVLGDRPRPPPVDLNTLDGITNGLPMGSTGIGSTQHVVSQKQHAGSGFSARASVLVPVRAGDKRMNGGT